MSVKMQGISKYQKYIFILLITFYVVTLLSSINGIVLRGEEPRRGAIAFEMEQSGNYIVPTMHGEYYYNKPPIFNWLIAGISNITGGINHAAVRLPSLLSLFVWGLVHFLFTRRYFGFKLAVLSTVILMTCAEILYHGSVYSGEIDLFYSFIVYLQAISMIHFYRSKQPLLLYLSSYLLMGIGFLTKGLPSFHFQAFGLLSLLFIDRRLRYFLSWQHLSGIVLGFGLIDLYFYTYSFQNDPWPFLLKQLAESADKSADGESLGSIAIIFLKFPLILLKILLPWSVFLLFLPFKKLKELFRQHPVFQFTVWFVLTNIWIYWISPGVRLRYIYMFLPFLAIIVAVGLRHFLRWKKSKYKPVTWLTFIVMMLLAVFFFVYPIVTGQYTFIFQYGLPFLFMLCGIGMAWLFYKYPPIRLYTFVFMLILARFFMNFYYFPPFQERFFKYGPFIEQAMEIAQEEPILLAGEEYETELKAEMLGIQFSDKKATIVQPPNIPYQLPYYFGVNSQKIMAFHSKPNPNIFYISRKEFIEDKPVTVYLTTDHCKTGCEGYVLYKLK